EVGVAVLLDGDHAAAQVAHLGERTGHVPFQPVVVPGAGRDFHFRIEVRRGTLAHEIDGGGRIAGRRHEAVRAADDLDAVVHAGVDVPVHQTVRHGHAHAVDLEIGDV